MIPLICVDTFVKGGGFDKEYERASEQLWNEFRTGKNISSFWIYFKLRWKKLQQEFAVRWMIRLTLSARMKIIRLPLSWKLWEFSSRSMKISTCQR